MRAALSPVLLYEKTVLYRIIYMKFSAELAVRPVACAAAARKGPAGICVLILVLLLATSIAPRFAQAATGPEAVPGNARFESFAQVKRLLLEKVYADHRLTLYCRARFHPDRRVEPPPGFTTAKHHKRAQRLEWEHVVPAENFGRFFPVWRDGDPQCVDREGRSFRGRRCAEKVSPEFRRMQADMHNLFPAIGAVNAARSNYGMGMLPGESPAFGSCSMKIARRKAEPPDAAKGVVARASLYMAAAYPRFRLSGEQKKLFRAWDRMFPPDEWECERERRIARLQGNDNPFVRQACRPHHPSPGAPLARRP